ncbi:hypothetical protein RVY52_004117 [Burkholderia cenocepacia]|nr:hypothetical protein [Burkholderia cenocepacia]
MLNKCRGALYRTALALLALPFLTVSTTSHAANAPLDVSVIYFGNPGDGGWTRSHEIGIQEAEKKYGNQIKVTRVENVPESADAARVFRNRASQVRISVMVIRRFGERDQFGRWCCAVNGL